MKVKGVDHLATLDAFEAANFPKSMKPLEVSNLKRIRREMQEQGRGLNSQDRVLIDMVALKHPEMMRYTGEVQHIKLPPGERYAELDKGHIYLKCKMTDRDIATSDLPFWTMKSMDGRWEVKSYNGTPTLAPTGVLLDLLEELEFTMDSSLLDLRKARMPRKVRELNLEGQAHELYPFQRTGVQEIERWNGRVLLADDMGLGKSAQALSWLYSTPKDCFPALIVIPASLKINWQREAAMWAPGYSVETLSGRGPKPGWNADADIIINYEILGDWLDVLKGLNFQTIIADEFHLCKNMKAKRTQAFMNIVRDAPFFIPLTGTPVLNNPFDLWPILNALDPFNWGNMRWYQQAYCKPKLRGGKTVYGSSKSLADLHERLVKTGMIRRLKTDPDIGLQLPKKERHVIPLAIDNMKAYRAAEEKYMAWANGINLKGNAVSAFSKIQELKRLAYEGKEKEIISLIKDVIDGEEKKLVVIGYHRDVIERLNQKFKGRVVRVQGGMSAKQKQEAVDAFQNDPSIDLFTGNIRAAGVGHTLTASHITFTIELDWNPMNHDQAEDRTNRIGQKEEYVFSYYLVAAKTIEEDIIEIQDNKRKMANAIVDGKESSDEELLSALMSKMQARHPEPIKKQGSAA